MTMIFKKVRDFFTLNPLQTLQSEFGQHCAQKNYFRFSILPLFNIFTQVACYFIYLYIYPATFKDMQQLDATVFTLFSLVYITCNIVFAVLFNRLRTGKSKKNDAETGYKVLLIFLVSYVVFESIETILEIEISGNIYRFLATFFMVAFLPLTRRRDKVVLLTLFTVFVEGGFFFMISQGYSSNNRFEEIILMFYLVCLVVSNISYNSAVRNFELHYNLVQLNEELRVANERLSRLAVIDPLTQISNRRAFDQYIALSWRAAYNDASALTVAMVDIDDFKAFNDTYGHQRGDECLCEVAECLKRQFSRKTDMVARFGGEEFVVLMSQANADDAHQLIERMQRSVRDLQIEHKKSPIDPFVTVSVGVATMVPTYQNRYEDLIRHADDARYIAKETGKNRVCYAAIAPPVSRANGLASF